MYFYYDNITVGFKNKVEKNPNCAFINTVHSKVDEEEVAVHLGDGEKVTFDINVDETLYPNNGVVLSNATFTETSNQNVTVGITVNRESVNQFSLISDSYKDTGYSQEMLKSTDYIGTLNLEYTLYTGNTTSTKKIKKYLVYSEHWRRK